MGTAWASGQIRANFVGIFYEASSGTINEVITSSQNGDGVFRVFLLDLTSAKPELQFLCLIPLYRSAPHAVPDFKPTSC